MKARNEHYRLKLNESFSIRNGWLQKGINIVKEDSKAFKKDYAPIVFGLGSNMCSSLKYYMKAFSLINDLKNGEVTLSEIGECIYKYDRYLEDIFSLFILHINSLENKYINTVPYFYFNDSSLKVSTKEEVSEHIKEKLEISGKVNISSLNNDISVLLRNYVENDDQENPENDIYSSPFSSLLLIKKDSRVYKKNSFPYAFIDPRIVFYNIIRVVTKDEFTFDELLLLDNNPTLALNLTEYSLLSYLDELDKNKYIRISKTAGLNTIKILKHISLDSLYEEHRREYGI